MAFVEEHFLGRTAFCHQHLSHHHTTHKVGSVGDGKQKWAFGVFVCLDSLSSCLPIFELSLLLLLLLLYITAIDGLMGGGFSVLELGNGRDG